MADHSPVFQHPEKWRETVDPFCLPYHTFRPVEILGYPHAGNDVFHARGRCQGGEITAYIKAARQTGASIQNEIAALKQLNFPFIPKVVDFEVQTTPFVVTEELPGQRLSVIVGENEDGAALSYMEEYGEMLGRLHGLKPDAAPTADRKFFHRPSDALLEKLGLGYLKPFFARGAPDKPATVFCHGDFHYANILWDRRRISAVLDFELSGYGNRDFDIAWALILRPGQKFLKTGEERRRFLDGYCRHGRCDVRAVRRCMAQIYVYFLEFSQNDEDYKNYVTGWLVENCTAA